MATSEALRRHIWDAIKRGANRKELETRLLKSGWPQEVVDEYLSELPAGKSVPGLVRLTGVTKQFGSNLVLDNINLEIKPGELLGIIGLSGGGKTTLLNTLVGFIEPDAGDVMVQLPDKTDTSVSKNRSKIKTLFGFAAQIPSFYGRLTVRENIEHFAALYNLSLAHRISMCDRLLRLVGLEKSQHTLAHNLSGGQQKRLDIACALVHAPAILILDEPTADLDPIIRNQIWDLITQINKQGTTVIVASHLVSEIERYCSTIAILRNQKIMEVGTTAQLRDIYSKFYELSIKTHQKDYGKLRAYCTKNKSLYKNYKEKDGVFMVLTPKPHSALQNILKFLEKQNDTAIHVHLDRPSIAEVFESLIKHEKHPLH